MNKIAIKGSKIGTDVIKYLESLGGINYYNYEGDRNNGYYFIDVANFIKCNEYNYLPDNYTILEEVPTKKLNNIHELWWKNLVNKIIKI